MDKIIQAEHFLPLLRRSPDGVAQLRGDENHPTLRGRVRFWQTAHGVLVVTETIGLPHPTGACQNPVFGFHIHGGNACTGTEADPFADSLTHYNPDGCPHPHHAGDLPPLFGNNGRAFSAVLTDRFTVREILGKTVILHSQPDDFTTQPAGNAGQKIACGVIQKYR